MENTADLKFNNLTLELDRIIQKTFSLLGEFEKIGVLELLTSKLDTNKDGIVSKEEKDAALGISSSTQNNSTNQNHTDTDEATFSLYKEAYKEAKEHEKIKEFRIYLMSFKSE